MNTLGITAVIIVMAFIVLAGAFALAITRKSEKISGSNRASEGSADDFSPGAGGMREDINSSYQNTLDRLDQFDERRRQQVSIVMAETFNMDESFSEESLKAETEVSDRVYGIINEIFGAERMCYRISENEFVIICVRDGIPHSEIEELKSQAAELSASQACDIGLAVGASSYDMCIDRSVKDTVSRTSRRMYVNKIQQKERKAGE